MNQGKLSKYSDPCTHSLQAAAAFVFLVCHGVQSHGASHIPNTAIPPIFPASAEQQRILEAADQLMNEYEISYVYGGAEIGDTATCDRCNRCLEAKTPTPKTRLTLCPECRKCGIDCSHFTQLVYENAGFSVPYITTSTMLEESKQRLLKAYHLVDIGSDLRLAEPGDLLVYRGHVVILEKNYPDGYADIVHATSGSDIRLPGQGIQRKRRADIVHFHGPLLRVLRHADLLQRRKIRPVR